MHTSSRRLLVSTAVLASAALLAALPALAGSSAGAGATVHAKLKKTVTVTITAANQFRFKLSTSKVPSSIVTFKITNKGSLPHTFKVCTSNKGGTADSCNGKGAKTIPSGKSAVLVRTFTPKGKYGYLCAIPGHAAAGMKGILTVT